MTRHGSDEARFPQELRDRYQPQAVLGRGGFGVVWRVHDCRLERDLALKVMELELDDPGWKRFGDESSVLARFRHPSLVRLFDAGRLPAGGYLALELIEGETMAVRVRALPEAALRRPRVVAWMLEVADGLEALHAEGVVHRDVKPANIMVTPDERAVLLDFGLARPMDRTAYTGDGKVVGTMAYSAPERLRGRDASPAADWFAWGVTLYAGVEGRLPWGAAAIMAAMGGAPLPRPEWRMAPADDPVREVVERCLAPEPSDRPAGAAPLRAALDPAVDREEDAQRTVRAPDRRSRPDPSTPTSGSAPAAHPSVPGATHSFRRRVPMVVAAVLAAGGALALALHLDPAGAALAAARPGAPGLGFASAPSSDPIGAGSLAALARDLAGAGERLEQALEGLDRLHPAEDPLAGRDYPSFRARLAHELVEGAAGRAMGELLDAAVDWIRSRDRGRAWEAGLGPSGERLVRALILVELDKDALLLMASLGVLERPAASPDAESVANPAFRGALSEALEVLKERGVAALRRIPAWDLGPEPTLRLVARTMIEGSFGLELLDEEAQLLLERVVAEADPRSRGLVVHALLTLVGWKPARRILECPRTEAVLAAASRAALVHPLDEEGPVGRVALLARAAYRWLRVADDCWFPIDEAHAATLAPLVDALGVGEPLRGRGWVAAMAYLAGIHSNHPTLMVRLPPGVGEALTRLHRRGEAPRDRRPAEDR